MRKFLIANVIVAILLTGRTYTVQADLLEQACLKGSLDMVKYHTGLLDKTLLENAGKIECLVYKLEKEIIIIKCIKSVFFILYYLSVLNSNIMQKFITFYFLAPIYTVLVICAYNFERCRQLLS